MFVEDELNREYRSKRWRICLGSIRNQNIDRNRGDFFGNDGTFRENLFVCFDFQIANRLRMVSKSPQNSFQIRTIEKEHVFHVHRGDLMICSLLHACGVTFRGKIGN
ncbi:hypothetical protein HYC85_014371 [Camellia sinensis]|uniref:Uncharacterized protein n=1 Tax=Camellia sinensis TaxID=4442 RepID=A0A7J7H991_CAMSI|nr:hypothetical protein HYC85_014371 [Camellia sinensis]